MASFTTKLSLGQKAFIVSGGLDPYIEELTVGLIRVIETHPKAKSPFSQNSCYKEEYMCFETGVGSGSVYTYGEHIFATREEAERGLTRRQQEVYKERAERDAWKAKKEQYEENREREVMKKYYVKTDYVPEDVTYLTAGKEYLLTDLTFRKNKISGGYLKDDDNEESYIFLEECAHLDFKPWTLVEKEEKDGRN